MPKRTKKSSNSYKKVPQPDIQRLLDTMRELENANIQIDKLIKKYARLKKEYTGFREGTKQLINDYNKLKEINNKLNTKNEKLESEITDLTADIKIAALEGEVKARKEVKKEKKESPGDGTDANPG